MNYYPNNNFYQNYSYGNGMYQNQQVQPTIATLQGKVVDSIDMVRVNEVPFGGFGVFPKGDLSEVYIKSWNSNGTTQINTYKPVPAEETTEAKEFSSIEALSKKMDELIELNMEDNNKKLEDINNQVITFKQNVSDKLKDTKIYIDTILENYSRN